MRFLLTFSMAYRKQASGCRFQSIPDLSALLASEWDFKHVPNLSALMTSSMAYPKQASRRNAVLKIFQTYQLC